MQKLKTWEMIKELTEYKPKYFGSLKQRFFMEVGNEDEPIICFLESSTGSIEFRQFKVLDEGFVEEKPIIHQDSTWIEISKNDANIYLDIYY